MDKILKNKATSNLSLLDNTDVTTWALPEGAHARLGRGRANDIAFSPNEQYFVVGTAIGLWIYDLPSLSPIALWDTERGMISTIKVSPDNQRIVTHAFSESIKIWDIREGVCITQIEKQNERDITNPIFSQDGEYIATISNERNWKIYFWCSHTGRKLSETVIKKPCQVYPICFSPTLNLLAGKTNDPDNVDRNNSDDDSIVIWEVETGEQIANITGYPDPVRRISISPCERYLAAGNWKGTIYVWDISSEQLETTYSEYGDAQIFPYFLPSGELITAAVSTEKVEIWNVRKREKINEFAHRGNTGIVSFSDSGTQMALASPSEIKIWRKSNNSDIHTVSSLHGHLSTMDTIVFSKNEKTLAAGFWSDNVLLWDLASRRSYRPDGEKLPGTSHNVYRSPNDTIITTNRLKEKINVYELGKNEPIAELVGPKEGLGRAQAYTSTGARIANVDRDDNIHIWERLSTLYDRAKTETWKKIATIHNDEEFTYGVRFSPTGMAFSPDGKQLATISRSRDCKACLWNVDTGIQIAELPITPPSRRGMYRDYDTGIAFSPDGNIIAGGTWHGIVLWNAIDGKSIIYIPHSEEYQRPITLCFSPCSQYLASGAWWTPDLQKVSIRLWKVETGENLTTFWGHTTDVQCFAFSQDSTLLASGGHDGAIYLWDLKPYL